MEAAATVGRIIQIENALDTIHSLLIYGYLFSNQTVVTDLEKYDFIVAGAGSAGTVVASRLAECNHTVLLVEAGDDPPLESITPGLLPFMQHTKHDWNYTTEYNSTVFKCHRAEVANLTNGRMVGGGSSINFMFYVRGCPDDFESWATAANDSTWNYKGVLPYFIKSENLQDPGILNSTNSSAYHGTSGFLGVSRLRNDTDNVFLKSFKELGNDIILDINSGSHLGYNYPMFTISDGKRQSTATTILSKYKNKKNLHVLRNAFVNKVLFDDDNNATGIEVTINNTTVILKAKKEVIVSAGGINTPRLLMNSGIGPADHLESLNITVRSDLPVGKNFQDHTAFSIPIKLEKSNASLPVSDSRRFPFETIAGYVALNESKTCPEYQTFSFMVPHDSPSVMSLCAFDFGLKFDICQKIFAAGVGTNTFFTTIILLHPFSRGEVLLRSADPTDPPIVRNGHISDERDLEIFVDAALEYIQILNTTHFKSVDADMVNLISETGCTDQEYWSREWWRCYVRCMMVSLYHYTGTCAMGSVVDSHLRVKGVNKLRVIDASVMPLVPSANTNAASIMIGEKGADFIKEDHSC